MDYFIADLHFGHANALRFDARPFADIQSHDQTLIKNWNSTVGDDDTVYILGDFSWVNASKTLEIFQQLNGSKVLIKGNHDGKLLKKQEIQNLFLEICDYKELKLEDKKGLILCHYPIPCFKNHYYGWYHFYGHVHDGTEETMMLRVKREMEDLYHVPCNMFNVGCMKDYMNYTPQSFESIINSGKKE